MLEFPSTTAVNMILPKDKFVEHLDLTPNLKKKLISDVVHIKILNKFSKSLLNFREEVDEVECSKSPHQLPTTNHAEASASAITEVLLLQIDLKKPDFDSKLVEAIARQNPHKLVFLLRYLQYAKLAVFYKKLYIGSWKPFEEVSLTAAFSVLVSELSAVSVFLASTSSGSC